MLAFQFLALATVSQAAWTLWGGSAVYSTNGPGGGSPSSYAISALTDGSQSDVCSALEQGGGESGNNYCNTALKCNNGQYTMMVNGPCTGDSTSTEYGSGYATLYKSDSDGTQGDELGTCTWVYNRDTGGCAQGLAQESFITFIDCEDQGFCG